jgi:hypothetical protein
VADAPAFDWVCAELESRTAFDRLEARAAVRIALQESGLEANSITVDQMRVVIDRVLPGELDARGIDDSSSLCGALKQGLKSAGLGDRCTAAGSPDEVFRRLGGS